MSSHKSAGFQGCVDPVVLSYDLNRELDQNWRPWDMKCHPLTIGTFRQRIRQLIVPAMSKLTSCRNHVSCLSY